DAKQLKDKRFSGFVRRDFLYRMVQSLNVLPFVCIEPFAPIAIPARRQPSGMWKIFNSDEMRTLGSRHTTQWFERIDATIARSRAGKPLATRINERNKLTIQVFPRDHFIVLSGAGGEIACGALIPVNNHYKDVIIDQTLYWRIV